MVVTITNLKSRNSSGQEGTEECVWNDGQRLTGRRKTMTPDVQVDDVASRHCNWFLRSQIVEKLLDISQIVKNLKLLDISQITENFKSTGRDHRIPAK